MHIPINLSSEPFRRDRPILVASGAGAVVLAGVLTALILMIVNGHGRAQAISVAVNRAQGEMRGIAAQQAQVDQILRQPANAEVLEQNLLLNTLIERKSISWTRIFADLEAVKPYNVKFITVRLPQINSRNAVTLDMMVGATDSLPVINLLRALEASPLFGPATPHTCAAPAQNQTLYQCQVSVEYGQKL
jgi:hypothetical protein